MEGKMRGFPATLLVLAMGLSTPIVAQADSEQGQWLVELRNSVTYKEGLERAVGVIEHAYDIGAVGGASQWTMIHENFRQAASSKGCTTGARLAGKSAAACPKLGGPKPGVLSESYGADRKRALEPAAESARPALLRQMLATVHSYGYAHGLEYGWRKNEGNIAWKGRYYKVCMEFADDSDIEKRCASAADRWAATEITRLQNQARAKKLPIATSRSAATE